MRTTLTRARTAEDASSFSTFPAAAAKSAAAEPAARVRSSRSRMTQGQSCRDDDDDDDVDTSICFSVPCMLGSRHSRICAGPGLCSRGSRLPVGAYFAVLSSSHRRSHRGARGTKGNEKARCCSRQCKVTVPEVSRSGPATSPVCKGTKRQARPAARDMLPQKAKTSF